MYCPTILKCHHEVGMSQTCRSSQLSSTREQKPEHGFPARSGSRRIPLPILTNPMPPAKFLAPVFKRYPTRASDIFRVFRLARTPTRPQSSLTKEHCSLRHQRAVPGAGQALQDSVSAYRGTDSNSQFLGPRSLWSPSSSSLCPPRSAKWRCLQRFQSLSSYA